MWVDTGEMTTGDSFTSIALSVLPVGRLMMLHLYKYNYQINLEKYLLMNSITVTQVA